MWLFISWYFLYKGHVFKGKLIDIFSQNDPGALFISEIFTVCIHLFCNLTYLHKVMHRNNHKFSAQHTFTHQLWDDIMCDDTFIGHLHWPSPFETYPKQNRLKVLCLREVNNWKKWLGKQNNGAIWRNVNLIIKLISSWLAFSASVGLLARGL